MTYTIFSQMPSGKNQVRHTRTGHQYPNKRFESWRELACLQLARQGLPKHPYSTPLALIVDYWPGDARTRDVDGIASALFHLLSYAGVIQNDSLIWNLDFTTYNVDREHPRVVLALKPWIPREAP